MGGVLDRVAGRIAPALVAITAIAACSARTERTASAPPPVASVIVSPAPATAEAPPTPTPWSIAAIARLDRRGESWRGARFARSARVVLGEKKRYAIAADLSAIDLDNGDAGGVANNDVLVGQPPDAWLVKAEAGADDASWFAVHHLDDGAWKLRKRFDTSRVERAFTVVPWSEGRMLALVEGDVFDFTRRDHKPKYLHTLRFDLVAGRASGPLPSVDLAREELAIGLAGAPTGDLWLVGAAKGRTFVDHWAPGAAHAKRELLDGDCTGGPTVEPSRLVTVRAGNDVFLGCEQSPWFFHYDGARWRALDTAFGKRWTLSGYDVDAGGHVWATFAAPGGREAKPPGLWRWSDGAGWERVATPPLKVDGRWLEADPFDVLALDSGIWLLVELAAAEGDGPRYVALLRDRPVAAARDL